MNLGNLMGLVTLVFLVIFLGIVVWAYSSRRHTDFAEAARLPLDDAASGDGDNKRREESGHE